MSDRPLSAQLSAEFSGTVLLVFFGDGAIAASVTSGGYGLLGIALLWGFAVTLGIYAARGISGAHLNPAVTVAMAAFRGFDRGRVIPFSLAQLTGAFAAAAAIHLAFGGLIEAFEAAQGIVRGDAGSQATAMIYATYAPNPGLVGTATDALARVSTLQWFAVEMLATGLLVLGILMLTDERNAGRPLDHFTPVSIGIMLACLVAVTAPVSMAALNPARDLGPRTFAALAGWGEVAIPGPRSGFWIPILAPIAGGLVGGAAYRALLGGSYAVAASPGRESPEAEGAA